MADDFVEIDVSPEQLAQLDKSGVKYESVGNTATSQPQVHDFLPEEPVKPTGPNFWQGMGNLAGAGLQGINQGATELGNIIQHPGPLMNQIGQAFQREAQHNDPMMAMMAPGGEHAVGLGLGALQGTAQLFNGLSGIPSALQNAWEGKQLSQPAIQIPTGDLDQYVNQNYPVSGFAGTMVPLGAVELATAGTATPEVAAAKTGALSGTLKATGTGAVYGLVGTPGEIQDRAKAAVTNAALGAGMHLGGKALGVIPETVGKDTTADVGLSKIRESAPTEEGFVKDPVTGQLIPKPEATPTTSANVPEAGPGVLTGRVSSNDPVEDLAPWDSSDIEEARNHDNNDDDGGGGGDPVFSPETGQSVRQPTAQHAAVADENMEAVGPSAQQDLGAISAVDQLRARQQQLMQQRGDVANENQESFGPSAQQDMGAISAVEQLRARQQQLAQQQQEQAVNAKADELHGKLTNFERIGAKTQANKLKAEIAEQAATHPDPVQRAAYQRALDKYAPAPLKRETALPKAEAPKMEGNVKVNLPEKPLQGQVTKTEEIPNEPQGKIQQPEGQQPAQRPEEVQPVAEQKPAGKSNQKTLKPKSEAQKQKQKLEKAREAVRILQGHADFGETPAHTILSDLGFKVNDAPNTGHVKNYRIFIPGEGEQTFQWDAPISSVNLNRLAGSIVKVEGGFEKLMSKVHELDAHSDINTHSPHEMNTLLESVGKDKLEAHEDAENKLFESFDQHLGNIEKAGTFEELEVIEEALNNPAYQHIYHGEVRKEVEDAFSRAVERITRPSAGAESTASPGIHAGDTADVRSVPDKNGNPKPEVKKKTEIDQEALDAISKPADTEKDSIFSGKKASNEGALTGNQKTQGTEAREHLQPEQAHKPGKFQSIEEIEDTPEFKKSYDSLKQEEQEKLHVIADAISNKKKILTCFYNPGTKTLTGVLTKRAEHGQELYTPKGLSVSKKGDILVHGYNENGELSSRRLDRFNGEVTKTTESGYEGLYKHPSDITEGTTFHPADAIVEQVVNPILKKQVQGKPIVESDYVQAYRNVLNLAKEAGLTDKKSMMNILEKMPASVREKFLGDLC